MHRRDVLRGLVAALPAASGAAQAQAIGLPRLLRQRAATDGVGFAAVQAVGAELRHAQAGVLRRGDSAPVAVDTLFEIGSITKAFTALLLADAVLQKRIRLDDPIEPALPDGIRLRDVDDRPLRFVDIATHRSGLPRMPNDLARAEQLDPYVNYTEPRLLAWLRGWRSSTARDTQFVYSNLGFGLLGYALSRLAGQPFDALMSTRVLRPLGLHDMSVRRALRDSGDLNALIAGIEAERDSASREATGHDAARQPVAPWHFDVLAGACGLVGSSQSMGRFMQAALGQFEHPLQAAFAMCLQRRADGESPDHPFGLAWEISPLAQRPLFNHDGATGGFSSSIWLDPSRAQGCVVLANTLVETRRTALFGLDPRLVGMVG